MKLISSGQINKTLKSSGETQIIPACTAAPAELEANSESFTRELTPAWLEYGFWKVDAERKHELNDQGCFFFQPR